MNDNEEIPLDRTLCVAVQTVRDYLQCNCSDETCPFDRLVSRMQRQREAENRLEYERQRSIEEQKVTGGDD